MDLLCSRPFPVVGRGGWNRPPGDGPQRRARRCVLRSGRIFFSRSGFFFKGIGAAANGLDGRERQRGHGADGIGAERVWRMPVWERGRLLLACLARRGLEVYPIIAPVVARPRATGGCGYPEL